MSQDYDKIFREVFKDIFPAVAQKVLGIPAGAYKPLPVDLQYTSEREADQVWEVTPDAGTPFVLHCEFQSANDKQMLSRMLLYYGFLYYQRKLPIQQYVIYVGRDRLQMDFALQDNRLTYSYALIDLRDFPYRTFLESDRSQEVLLAILADFGGEPAGLIAEKIIVKLEELSTGTLELSQRSLQLVRLSVLRNLSKTVYKIVKKMPITIDVKEDDFIQEIYQEGQLAGKEETAVSMLKEGFGEEVVVRITKLPADRITQLRQQLQAGQ
jgi:predicted transposase YdaD